MLISCFKIEFPVKLACFWKNKTRQRYPLITTVHILQANNYYSITVQRNFLPVRHQFSSPTLSLSLYFLQHQIHRESKRMRNCLTASDSHFTQLTISLNMSFLCPWYTKENTGPSNAMHEKHQLYLISFSFCTRKNKEVYSLLLHEKHPAAKEPKKLRFIY